VDGVGRERRANTADLAVQYGRTDNATLKVLRRLEERELIDTQGPDHANSICVFSGLEDGEKLGTTPGPGAPPQNWGHVQEAARDDGATPQSQGVRHPARRLLQRSHRLPGRGRRRAVNR
jgi:hypothetical protein